MDWKIKFRREKEKQPDHHPELYLPEIQKRTRRKRRLWILAFAALACFVLFMVGAAMLFRSSLFQIKEINIQGNREATQTDILLFLRGEVLSSGWWQSFLGFSNILTWPDNVPDADLTNFPMLKSVTIKKDAWSRRVSVTVEERQIAGIWCLLKQDPNRCFWFDEDGTVLAPAPQVEGHLILVVSDSSQDDLSAGARILPPENLGNMSSIFRVLRASGLEVKEIRLDDLSLQEIKVELESGPALYFSLRFPSDNDLAVLKDLRSKDPQFANISYIDFRVENRAFYK